MYNYPSFPLDLDAEVFAAFWGSAPQAGSRAPDATLESLAGQSVRLRDLWRKRPLVIEFGSFS